MPGLQKTVDVVGSRSYDRWVRHAARAPSGCAATLLLALLPGSLGAAPPGRFTRLSVEQGLSQSTVQAILQDHVGFLWFGTEEGLNRYDGYTFVVFKRDAQDPNSLPDDLVSALYEDRQRRLWVGTGHGLGLFDRRTETFARVPSIRERVTGIVEDAEGNVWVGTEGGGLFEGKAATGAFVQHRRDPRDPTSLGSDAVSALIRDRRGRIWIGTRDGGVGRLENGPRGTAFVHYRHDPADPRTLAADEVWGLAEDAAGNVWVATYGGGLNVLDHETGTFRRYRHRPGDPHSLGTDRLTCLYADRSGTLWIGTDGAGLQRYDTATDRFQSFRHDPAEPNSLSQNVVRTLYEDVQGQLWVGTFLGGANVLKRPRRAFGYFTHGVTDPSSLGAPVVDSFLEDTAGRIWVGTWRSWLHRFDRQTGTFVRYRFPSSAVAGGPTLFSLREDRRGRIWVATYRGGLGRFDPERGAFTIYNHRPGDPGSLSDDEVWALAVGEEGALWVGTNAGLDCFDTNRGVVTARYGADSPNGLSHGRVRALLFDRQGNLWIGTLAGLNLLRRGSSSFVSYRHDDRDPRSLSNDGVVSLHEDHLGRLWVGTYGGGLNRIDPATGAFTTFASLPSKVIYSIEEDESGRLWLGTNHGLVRIDPATGHIENFDLTNGLQSLQFQLGASLRTRDGRLLFGSVDGFYDFDPDEIKPDTYAPPVVLTSLRIFNQPAKLSTAFSTLDEITLSHRDKIFSIEFSALDYALPRRNRYAYLMQGFSDQWIQLGGKREVTLTNLDPGAYVFRVKASNSDGVWNESSVAALRVVVTPPFWRTFWFRGLCLIALAVALLTAHRMRVRHLTADIEARRRAQEAEAALRSAVEKAALEWERTFHSIEALLAVLDGRGRVLRVNRAVHDSFGSSGVPPCLGRLVNELGPGEPWARAAELAREVVGTGHGAHAQVDDQATGRTWDLTVMPVLGVADDEKRTIVVASDVTTVVELQSSLRHSETMAAMGSLLAGVAHEVRNPLFGISANVDAFEARFGHREEFAETISFLRSEVNRLVSLMHDLLEFGRPVQEELVPGSLLDVVTEALGSCEMLAIQTRVEVVNQVPAHLPAVRMVRQRLSQAFENLLRNAVQYSPVGGRVIIEAAHERRNGTAWIRCSVKDGGPGFREEDLGRVFQPFFSRRQGGIGLGLAIVQRIVEGHGGSVSVGNRTEGGGEVTIRLPCS